LRIISGAVVALITFNVSVSSSWLNTALHYTNDAARSIGHQHSRDYSAKAVPMPYYDASPSSTAAPARGQAHARRVADCHWHWH